jgi:hypothetical protein
MEGHPKIGTVPHPSVDTFLPILTFLRICDNTAFERQNLPQIQTCRLLVRCQQDERFVGIFSLTEPIGGFRVSLSERNPRWRHSSVARSNFAP